jgi:hypothetical protein
VHLAKAEQASIRLSSFFEDDDLDVLGIWRWMLERQAIQGLPPPDAGDAQAAVMGLMWMLTPFSTINLLHVVQQPLIEPQFTELTTPRDPAATFAYFNATVNVHGKSTARLDVQASWEEIVDDPSKNTPENRSMNTHVFDFTIHLPDEVPSSGETDPSIVPIAIYNAGSDIVFFQAPSSNDASGRRFLARHEFGDTKHRNVSYQCIATTRFREYFPPEITNDPAQITRISQVSQIRVPSSARPMAPVVVSAIPVFEWSRTQFPDGHQERIRKGGGVRVYLERPWFSSGDGELLAVVLANEANYPPDAAHRQYVTHWGNDPIWLTNPLTGAPLPSNFTQAVATGTDLVLEETAVTQRVLAVGHRVEFDPDRKLWYCDIHIDAGDVYCPFVRLALTRYQPDSLPGLELSRVVLADFVQLWPDRQVTVSPVEGDPNSFTIAVEGLTYQSSTWYPSPDLPLALDEHLAPGSRFPHEIYAEGLVSVQLERRIPNTRDEAGWELMPKNGEIIRSSGVAADKPEGSMLWNGKVTLPGNRLPGEFRVVIRESELLNSDRFFSERLEIFVPGIPDHPPTKPELGKDHIESRILTFTPGDRRLIFAEAIEL